MAITTLLMLAGFRNDPRYVDIARQALAQMQTPTGGGMMSQYPLSFGQWLQAVGAALCRRAAQKTKGETDSQGWPIHLAFPT